MTRAEQGERNRALVLAAARRVFLERGYAGATLDAIAEEAGFSKGVVYSQFAGKPDLFLALLERRIAERAEQNARVSAGLAGLDGLRALLEANARLSEEGGDWSRLLIEFRLIAARTPRSTRGTPRCTPSTLEHFTEVLASVLAEGRAQAGAPAARLRRADPRPGQRPGAREGRRRGAPGRAPRRPVGSRPRAARVRPDTVSDTPPAGGPDAHHDRTEALVPRTP